VGRLLSRQLPRLGMLVLLLRGGLLCLLALRRRLPRGPEA